MAHFKVNAIVLNQKGHKLYSFKMRSDDLRKIAYVLPRSKDNPTEIQRKLTKSRILEIGDYIMQPNSLIPNNIIIHFEDEITIHPGVASDVVVLEFDVNDQDLSNKPAYILDGQHRLMGFDSAPGIEFDLAVVALVRESKDLAAKIFADINSNQKPVEKNHLIWLRKEIQDLDEDEDKSMALVERLAKDVDSVLVNKIKMYPDDKKTWISGVQLGRWIKPHVEPGGCLSGRPSSQATILKNYFKAVSTLFPDSWGNLKESILCKSMGLDLILSCLPLAVQRCNEFHAKSTTSEAFQDALQPLKTCKIENPLGSPLLLDWKSSTFGGLSSNKGKKFIMKDMKRSLEIKE